MLRFNRLGWNCLNPSCKSSGFSLEPWVIATSPGSYLKARIGEALLLKAWATCVALGHFKHTASLVQPKPLEPKFTSYEMPRKSDWAFLGKVKAKSAYKWALALRKRRRRRKRRVWVKGQRFCLGKSAPHPLPVIVQAFQKSVASHLRGVCSFLFLFSFKCTTITYQHVSCMQSFLQQYVFLYFWQTQAGDRGVFTWWAFLVMRFPLKIFS